MKSKKLVTKFVKIPAADLEKLLDVACEWHFRCEDKKLFKLIQKMERIRDKQK